MSSRPASARVNNIEAGGEDRTSKPQTGMVSAGLLPSFHRETNATDKRFINWGTWGGLLIVIAVGVGFWFAVGLLIVKFVR